ncbi:uncharacterized protein LAJ45_09518 [Morchella importuna]|uniref:Cytochrome P450 n=1 Tax=Morchella conica CCBAS932 TaxID=1392247 RepID=A0A3N4KCT4_9PEZI|nr:uncharacterized protein LAJ45_09518 [Morchella importuna]KAH8146325.1 hypothetical protein LAJ45_09518 [Morchella importuna]RPB08334.1 cytochrome P450 [Morchella conica CCBAS932]
MGSTLSRLEVFTPYLTYPNLLSLAAAYCALYLVVEAFYNLFINPNSIYPGPKLAAVTKHWISVPWVAGNYPLIIKGLHEKYGPVVRIGPNELSYSSASSWKDIYGHVGGRKVFTKSSFYNDGTEPSVVSERDPHKHGRLRRLLSNGFSARSLAEQEPVVHQFVDKFIMQINKHVTNPKGDDMVKWYTFVAFDIIGDLAFGDPFGSLEDGKTHFWVENVSKGVAAGKWIFAFQKNWILSNLIPQLVPKHLKIAREKHLNYCQGKIDKRLEEKNPKKDLLTVLIAKHNAGERFTPGEMRSNSQLIIVAGSETTATFLSGTSFYLCRNPATYKKLVDEIRGAFSSYDEITGLATESLPYLKAVIDEGLRIYPPVPMGMPRVSPGETIDGKYVPEGTIVMTSSYAATHSELNFHRPDDFVPERWIDPNCTDKKEASQPFLLGSRVCLGRSLALLEMRLILCKMLWSYDMEMVNPEQEWFQENTFGMLWEKPKLPLRFIRREGVEVPPADY